MKKAFNITHIFARKVFPTAVALGALAALYLLSRYNYLLFHTVVEIGAVAVAWSVFLLVWSARRLKAPPGFVMLGVGYLFVGGLDLLHTLAYEGMDVFGHEGADLATQLWIAARYIEAAALLLFPFTYFRRLLSQVAGITLAAAFLILLGAIFIWDVFPVCFDPETGLTPFKKGSEYVLMAAFASAAFFMWRRRSLVGKTIALFLVASMLVTVASEFTFTLYASPYGAANMAGHLLKVVSFALIYRALVAETIERPLDVLGRQLRDETRRYAGIIETATDGFWVVNMAGRIQDANAAALKMLGYTREQLLSMTVNDIDILESSQETEKHLQSMCDVGYDLFETKHRRSDGSILDVEVSCSFLPGSETAIVAFVRDISARKRAESYLQFQATISEQVSDAIIATDLDQRITSWNLAAERIYGWTEDEALGKPVDELLQTQYFEKKHEEAQTILPETGAWKGEVRQKSKDGQKLMIEASVSWVRDADGNTIGGVTANRDMTERREAEQLLAQSEARYRSIVSALPDLLFRINSNLCFTDVQTTMPEMLLAPIDEIIGHTAWDLLPTDIAELTREKVQATLDTGQIQIYYYAMTVQGEQRECETRMVPCGDDEVLVIVRDVTEALQAERRLQESEARYLAVINDQTELICRFTEDGVLTFVNKAYCRYFDKTPQDLLGRPFFPLIPEKDREYVHAMFSSLSPAQPIVHYENRVIRPDGSMGWMEWTDRAIYNKNGEFIEYQGVGRDITVRKQLQNRLLEASEREQKRLAADLHDGLCQDLKSLEIDVALLEDTIGQIDAGAAARATQIGKSINKAVRTAYSIVRGMLPAGLDAESFSSALLNLIEQSRTQEKINIKASIDNTLKPAGSTQAYHLYRIAQEALGNAIHHSGASSIQIQWGRNGEHSELSIQDDGGGFDESDRNRPGGGMGMLVMHSRAQAIGANIDFFSIDGQGTEFRCILPLATSEEMKTPQTEPD
jgi:PAS domain S-box-containing protein